MTFYIKDGTRFLISPSGAVDIREQLPVGTYTVKFDEMSGQFFLDTIADFHVSHKIYGDTKATAERILSTFFARDNATGALLSGEQGSGKTLLAKLLSVYGRRDGIPTIVINDDWHGEKFNVFMQSIEQPTVVLFDEFEKNYDREPQEKMLTLLDGVYPSKKLFLLTCNDSYRINSHMKNRPGRIFYHLEFKGLEQDFIVEYCEDNLKNKEHIEGVCRIAMLFGEFNFDMLKGLVEEMNRYDESPQESLKMLNANPEGDGGSKFKVTLTIGEKDVPAESLYAQTWSGNPLANKITVLYRPPVKAKKKEKAGNIPSPFSNGKLVADWEAEMAYEDEPDWERIQFTSAEHLVDVGKDTGFTFETPKGERLVLVKDTATAYDWRSAL